MPNPSIFPAIPNLNARDRFANLISNATKYVMDQDCAVEVRKPYISPDYAGKYREGDSSRIEAITDRINNCIDAFWEPLEPIPVLKVPPPTEEELNIGAFVPAPENVVHAEPEESEDEKFVRQETESMGDAILGVDGVIPKRRKSKVAQP